MQIPQVIAKRIQLKTSLENIIEKILQVYGLGEYADCERFEKGYEELNLKLTTSRGIYVVKIFSRTRTRLQITDYIKGLSEFSKAGIPVPKLIMGNKNYLNKISGSFVCLTDFFEGLSFSNTNPAPNDISNITEFLAGIHKLSFKIQPNYDPWGTANLLTEFKLKSKFLNKSDLQLIQPVVDKFSEIDFSKFRKSIIHGDLQRQHVLKNKKGKYCILDLGCMDYNSTIIDLAIFIAQFEADLNQVLKTYLKYNYLSPLEISHLPLLIKATFAVYLIQSNYLIASGKDKSNQTLTWLKQDRKALKKI